MGAASPLKCSPETWAADLKSDKLGKAMMKAFLFDPAMTGKAARSLAQGHRLSPHTGERVLRRVKKTVGLRRGPGRPGSRAGRVFVVEDLERWNRWKQHLPEGFVADVAMQLIAEEQKQEIVVQPEVKEVVVVGDEVAVHVDDGTDDGQVVTTKIVEVDDVRVKPDKLRRLIADLKQEMKLRNVYAIKMALDRPTEVMTLEVQVVSTKFVIE